MTTTEKAIVELNKIVQLFSSTELHKTVATVYIKTAGKPSDRWSLGNKILMVMSGTTDGRTFDAWKAAKRYVKSGAKAFYILAPNYATIPKKDKDGNPVMVDGKPVTFQILTGFRAQPEFRYEDTDGQALEEYKPKQLPPLIDVAQRWNMTVKYDNTYRGEEGSFNPSTNTIRLCVEDPAAFFHELAHKAHSKIEALKPGQELKQEVIAELTAATLSELFGYDSKAASYDYIASYARTHDPDVVGRLCLDVLDKVQKILALILEEHAEPVPAKVIEVAA